MQSCASVNSYTGQDELHKSVAHITGQVDTGTAQHAHLNMKLSLQLTVWKQQVHIVFIDH